MNLKNLWKKYRVNLLFIIIGAIGGYIYWKEIGCLSGTCPLKSLWYYDALLGALVSLLILDLIKAFLRKRKKYEKKNEA